MARLRHDYGLKWHDLWPFMARNGAINGGFFGRFWLDFGRFWFAFGWPTPFSASIIPIHDRRIQVLMAVYGAIWRVLVGFGRFWSPSIVPEAVYQGCIRGVSNGTITVGNGTIMKDNSVFWREPARNRAKRCIEVHRL